MKKKIATFLLTVCMMVLCAFVAVACNEQSHSHTFGEVTYTWSEDNTVCTATRVCQGDSTHVETEQAQATITTTQESTYLQVGVGEANVSFANPNFESQSKSITLPKKNAITAFDGAIVDGNDILYVVSKDTTSLNFSTLIQVPDDCTLTILDTYNDPVENNDTANIYPFQDGSENDFKIKIVAGNGETVFYDLMVHKIYEITVTYKETGSNGAILYTETIDSAQVYTPNPDYVNNLEGYTFQSLKDWNNNDCVPTVLYWDTYYFVERTPNRYIVTFDVNAGDLAGESEEVVYGTVPNLPVPNRPGCEFLGWELDGLMITWDNGYGKGGFTWNITQTTEIVAKWEYDTYSIRYELDGGINNSENITSYRAYDGSFTLKDPTKADALIVNSYKTAVLKAEEGSLVDYYTNNKIRVDQTAKKYTFAGWYLDDKFENRVTTLELTFGTRVLYAKWTEQAPVNEVVDVDYLLVDKDGNYDPDGDYLLMGSYFQTVKSADVTIDTTLNGSNGWSVGSDGCLYKDTSAYKRTSSANDYYFSDNTQIVGGETYYFKLEPIRWRLLNGHPNPNGQGWTVLMSDKALTANPYDTQNEASYETSYLREFLNTNFLGLHFNDTMKAIMVDNNVDNSVSSTKEMGLYAPQGFEEEWENNPYVCANTTDKIYAMSASELTSTSLGFSTRFTAKDARRTVTATDYALAMGSYIKLDGEYKGNCTSWWTRSPLATSKGIMVVQADGSLAEQSTYSYAFSVYSPKSDWVSFVPTLKLDIRRF